MQITHVIRGAPALLGGVLLVQIYEVAECHWEFDVVGHVERVKPQGFFHTHHDKRKAE